MTDTQGRDPAVDSNPDLGRLMCRATELAHQLDQAYRRPERDDEAADHRAAAVAEVVRQVLAFEPAHQQPALAMELGHRATACAGPTVDMGRALATELAAALTTPSRELPAALAMMRSAGSLLTGYEPSDLMVAAMRDAHPTGASEADADGVRWRTYKPGARRVVLALRGDPHLEANTGRQMQPASTEPADTTGP